MTMTQHTQTSAPNTAPATSVSPLEQSGSSKTKFSKGKGKPRAAVAKTDIYQTVTDSIVEALESGVKPWVCPWIRNGVAAGLPANFSTDTPYNAPLFSGFVLFLSPPCDLRGASSAHQDGV